MPHFSNDLLLHPSEDGQENPIGFTSQYLGCREKYSQLEEEGLAIVFAVNQYQAGCQFAIISDHKPLFHIFGESRTTPTLASAWIQCWT